MERHLSTRAVPGFICGCLAMLLLHSVAAAGDTDSDFTLGTGIDLSHGDYGSDQSTDTYTLPITIDYRFTDDLSVTLVLPYMYQSNNALIPMGGNRFPMQGSGHGGSVGTGSPGNSNGNGDMGGPGHMGPGSGSGGSDAQDPMGAQEEVPFSDQSQSGLGDMALTLDYGLLKEGESLPGISTQLYVKFPTADEDKGLGTGAYDYGVGFSVGKWFSSWQLEAQVLYVVPGSTSSFDPSDYWDWSLSSSYLVSDRWNVGMGVSGASTPFSGTDDTLDLDFAGSYWASPRTSIGAFVSFGLSESSADYSAGLYGMFSF